MPPHPRRFAVSDFPSISLFSPALPGRPPFPPHPTMCKHTLESILTSKKVRETHTRGQRDSRNLLRKICTAVLMIIIELYAYKVGCVLGLSSLCVLGLCTEIVRLNPILTPMNLQFRVRAGLKSRSVPPPPAISDSFAHSAALSLARSPTPIMGGNMVILVCTEQSCQIAITKFLDCRHLALRD